MNPNNILHVINLDTNQPVDPYANPELREIILRTREQRILSLVRQAKSHSIALRIWEGVMDDLIFPCKNISRAFKKVVQYAKDERLPMIRIAEDDMRLTSKKSWAYYIDNTPDDFDLYLGGIYSGRIQNGRLLDGYSGNTLITVHERFYDFFLSADENKHLDNWLGKNAAGKKIIVCEPFVCKQLHGYSDDKKKIQDYTMFEKDWTYL